MAARTRALRARRSLSTGVSVVKWVLIDPFGHAGDLSHGNRHRGRSRTLGGESRMWFDEALTGAADLGGPRRTGDPGRTVALQSVVNSTSPSSAQNRVTSIPMAG